MKKNYFLYLLLFIVVFFAPKKSYTQAAPPEYEGVMLQGFYWDAYQDSQSWWNSLEMQASDIGADFDLIWLPPSGNDVAGHMGYHPVYYFDQNSSFGTQIQLKSLISALNAEGCGAIADIVVNHRNGVANWTDFPAETYKGITYTWGPEAICSDDEVALQLGQPTPTGNPDTGEGWSGARDIDHTNENVRNTIKAYLDFLKSDIGYVGWRYDVAKGYSASYMGEYSKASGCEFAVGEYWDSSYDALTAYIEGSKAEGQIATGVFDFALKYALNDACNQGEWNKLVWKRYGTLDQPAGLLHMDSYTRYAYTFIDNHDTDRKGNGVDEAGAITNRTNLMAANAFILSHPGIPCVYYPHWRDFKSEISKMIAARKSVGIHSQSTVNVLETGTDIYLAEVVGKKGSLLIKVGTKFNVTVPDGYELYAWGNNYAIWTKSEDAPISELVELTVTPDAGTYIGGVNVTLTADGANPPIKIYYTTDGIEPTESSAQVESGYELSITQNTTLKVLAVDAEGNKSAIQTKEYLTEQAQSNTITVKWHNSQNWTGDMYIYAWDNIGFPAGPWPGSPVAADIEGWYSHTFSVTEPINIIFNNNGTKQTINLTDISADACFEITSQTSSAGHSYVVFTECDQTNETGQITVKWENSQNWSGDMYLFAWDASGGLTGSWPGIKAEMDDLEMYSYTFNSDAVNVIFNNGASQTFDIENIRVNTCYFISNTLVEGKHNVKLMQCPEVPTSMEETEVDVLLIYPNPAEDVIYIRGANEEIEAVQIFSISGGLIKSSKCVENKVSISSLPQGYYIVGVKILNEMRYFNLLKR